MRRQTVFEGNCPVSNPPSSIDDIERTRKRAERASRKETIRNKRLPITSEVVPWAKRSKPARGDLAEQLTYAAVGEALSSWSAIEMAMTGLFITFVNAEGDYMHLAAKSFGAVRTFEGRQKIIETASKYFFEIMKSQSKDADDELSRCHVDNLKFKFSRLLSDIGEAVSRRNEIAHGIVAQIWIDEALGEGTVLQATPMDQKTDMLSVSKYFYDSKSLLHYSAAFKGLYERVHNINIQLRVLRTTPQ